MNRIHHRSWTVPDLISLQINVHGGAGSPGSPYSSTVPAFRNEPKLRSVESDVTILSCDPEHFGHKLKCITELDI